MEIKEKVQEAIDGFKLPGELKECVVYGNGHINDTYRLTYETPNGTKRYILQRMSCSIFKDPVGLMENVGGVTSWLRKKIIANGGDLERETLTIVKSQENLPYFRDSKGEYWRVYLFIEGATSYDAVKDDNDFYQSAVSFGHFQRLLADYPAETLHETIKDFHNTPDRLKKFKKALFLQIIIFCIKQNPEENLFFLPGLLLPFRYFGSLNELFSETILLNTRCSLDES